jgi:hypothetical protein
VFVCLCVCVCVRLSTCKNCIRTPTHVPPHAGRLLSRRQCTRPSCSRAWRHRLRQSNPRTHRWKHREAAAAVGQGPGPCCSLSSVRRDLISQQRRSANTAEETCRPVYLQALAAAQPLSRARAPALPALHCRSTPRAALLRAVQTTRRCPLPRTPVPPTRLARLSPPA